MEFSSETEIAPQVNQIPPVLSTVNSVGSLSTTTTESKSSTPSCYVSKTCRNSAKYCCGYRGEELIRSVKSGNLSAFERLLAGGAHGNFCEEKVASFAHFQQSSQIMSLQGDQRSLLMLASLHGQYEVVEYLLGLPLVARNIAKKDKVQPWTKVSI